MKYYQKGKPWCQSKSNYFPADVTRQAVYFRKGIYSITQLSFSITDDAGGVSSYHLFVISNLFSYSFKFLYSF